MRLSCTERIGKCVYEAGRRVHATYCNLVLFLGTRIAAYRKGTCFTLLVHHCCLQLCLVCIYCIESIETLVYDFGLLSLVAPGCGRRPRNGFEASCKRDGYNKMPNSNSSQHLDSVEWINSQVLAISVLTPRVSLTGTERTGCAAIPWYSRYIN